MSLLASIKRAEARHQKLLTTRKALGPRQDAMNDAANLPPAAKRLCDAAATDRQQEQGHPSRQQQDADRRMWCAASTSAQTPGETPGHSGSPPALQQERTADQQASEQAQQQAAQEQQGRQGFRPASFYTTRRLQQVEERVLRFLANVRQRLAAPADSGAHAACWQLFPTQQPAFDYADTHAASKGGAWGENSRSMGCPTAGANRSAAAASTGSAASEHSSGAAAAGTGSAASEGSSPDLRVFSLELGPEGKRRFLVTTYAQLWRRYRELLPQHRHYYEIIREGWPCHVYFDLEFQRQHNPEVDGQAAVDALLSLLADELQARFQLQMEPSWVLELDSSTDAKFSRHLIIRVPGAAFASNAHVGALVAALCLRAREQRGGDQRCAALFVSKGEGEETLFVDTAVYSRNRAFRLYLSSKAGKPAVLHATSRFSASASLSQQEVFSWSLICNVMPSARLLRCFEEGAADGPASAAAALRALRAAGRSRAEANGSTLGSSGSAGSPGAGSGSLGAAGQLSYGPLPESLGAVEGFISAVCCEGGVQGRLRSWALLRDFGLLILNIRDNRWCGNIGRAHKSNGIFYTLDLQQGWWCQRCYDPDCRGYRSPLTALPPELLGLWALPAAAEGAGNAGWQQNEAVAAAGAGRTTAGGAAGGVQGMGWDDDAEDELLLQALEQYEAQRGQTELRGEQEKTEQQQQQQHEEPEQTRQDRCCQTQQQQTVKLWERFL